MPRQFRRIAWLVVLAIAAGTVAPAFAQGKVNINTAELEQLTLLPRVGPVVAQRILDFREQNGGFKSPRDLLLVSGIGDRTFDLIEPYVSVEGETTLSTKVSSSKSDD
jgi:competence protein ComEA